MSRTVWGAVVGALLNVALLASCSSSGEGPAKVDAADAYAAAIRWYLSEFPRVPSTTDGEPEALTVYVAPADGNAIDTDAQASVVEELADMKDEVFVQFADVRDDAIDLDKEGQPVKDVGVLLLVGPVEEAPPPVEVEIGVYHSMNDEKNYLMRIVKKGSEDFDVTAVTELGQS